MGLADIGFFRDVAEVRRVSTLPPVPRPNCRSAVGRRVEDGQVHWGR
ncbi:hypothetical protein USDA257_p06140 (plasmid) [Sinorhizobium fredii USDA 257]|uniref:Uncharacterized protein n=1 Tax=Sinorhizobium fredii (strain USDA 257) TaxID=1185652 RepID=I3XHH3_SINF2|nr:hypothetical protein USDA257_p06140 [Sinorhizobium fredii USDA 257]